jgi:hypothetical protein
MVLQWPADVKNATGGRGEGGGRWWEKRRLN